MTIIDGLVFLGSSHFGYELDAAAAFTGMDAVGTEMAVAVPMHPHRGDFAAANDGVAQAAEKSGGRLMPLCRVDPWEGEAAVAEVRRAVREGARGVFLHPSEERFRINDMLVRPVVEAAAELGTPVMVAAGYHLFAEPLQLGAAAQWTPDNTFVLTNGGQFNISGLSGFDAELALGNDNVHVHTTAMYREDFLEGVVAKFGPERLLFASAAPLFTMQYERLRVDLAHFSEAETELILGGNTARIFGEVSK
ncbi:MAG TPA: amidohydrolase family protein [Kribbella sp.]|uniref:amidohydrolase family protein n=1 Tax=Kribbella sp. TaxID=1871183 RepID=UPI002D785E60|nr:amidohydrolase family protein [Kribbella sp.]HET6294878.1 amidohydrolase family protein [Kribbella sp.]